MRIVKLLGLLAGICWLGGTTPVLASSFSFGGSFAQDDNRSSAEFTIVSNATVSIQSWGFAGGVDPIGATILPGGFATVLSIFDSTGNLAAGFDTGGTAPGACSPRNIDPVSGFCLDAYLQVSLSAGTYTAVLTELDNVPIGPTFADGFTQDGQGNFTGPENLGGPGSFIAPFGYQRTANFQYSISGADTARSLDAASIPEPASTLLMVSALAVLATLRAQRKA